jgi:hypothetical protein
MRRPRILPRLAGIQLRLGAALILIAGSALAQGTASPTRPFTIDDALNVNSGRIEDVTRDGRWVALAIHERRDGLGIDHARFGDPTYDAPSPAEFVLLDAVTGKARHLFPNKVDERGATFSKDGGKLAFFIREGDNYALFVHDVGANRTRAVPLQTKLLVASSSPVEWSPDGKSLLITLRPDGWLQQARQAFIHMTDGPIVVQDASKPFLAWDAVRNLGNR